MMPSRSALLLLYCATCLSLCRSAVAAPVIAPVVETDTTNLAAGTSVPSFLAQATPTPTDNPLPIELFPGVGEQKPTTKPTPAASANKSNLPMLWIGTGTVLVIIAGVLLYLLSRSEKLPESVESETPLNNNHENNQDEDVTPKGSEVAEDDQNPFPEPPDVPTSNHYIDPDRNGYISQLPPALESSNTQESTAKVAAESVEVQETTRLAKINIVDELIRELQSPDPTKRRKAIWELAQRGDSRAIQPLVNLLIDADSNQRSLILEAVSQIGNRTLKPLHRALAISLQDENAEVRKNAIRDVTRIYDMMAQVTQLLRHAVDDPDVEVQETARWALSQLNRNRGISGIDSFPNWPNSKNSPEN